MHLPDRNAMYKEYLSGLQSLRQGLPERFAPTLDKLIAKVGLAWAFRILGFIVLALGVPAAMFLRERTRRATPNLDL